MAQTPGKEADVSPDKGRETEASKGENELKLHSLPIVVRGIKPFPQELPMFLLRLATEVDYSNEQKCIQNISEEIAFYYARYVDFLTL